MTRRGLNLIALFLLCSTCARAEDWPTTKRACANWAADKKQYHSLEECVIDFMQLEPVTVAAGSIRPGTATAFGARYKREDNWPRWKSNTVAKGLVSTSGSTFFGAQLTVIAPFLVYKPKALSTSVQDDWQPLIHATASRFDLKEQNFYGIGPDTTLANLAVYRQVQYDLDGDIFVPMTTWFGVGSEVHFLHVDVLDATGQTTPPLRQTYGEAGAPGATTASSLAAAGLSLGLQKPRYSKWWPQENHFATIAWQHYGEVGSTGHTFDQLHVKAATTLDVGHKLTSHTGIHRERWRDAICFQETGHRCLLGTATLNGGTTASFVSAGNSVPFYLQPTLGGTDVNGEDTLRGFTDYRFRAPDAVILQAAFDKPLITTRFGGYGIYAFADAGKVALTPGDVALTNLRHDVGLGFFAMVNNKIAFRAYIAFGGGEGVKYNAKPAQAF